MKSYLIILGIILSINLVFIGILENYIKKVGKQIELVENSFISNQVQYTSLVQKKHALSSKERIKAYAQENLKMVVLNTDQLAAANVKKQISQTGPKDRPIFTIIDAVTPSLHVFEYR